MKRALSLVFVLTLLFAGISPAHAAPADAVAGENVEGLAVTVEMDEDPKCVRCWLHHPDIGKDAEHPELCPRCAKAVG